MTERKENLSGILVMNKPQGFTSFDVIGKLRGILKTKKMGHTGTLDPMATGVLPVFVGKATKAIPFLENHDKRYTATLQLGISTDTQDSTGTILTKSEKKIEKKELEKVLFQFLGEQNQIPPMYSAIKIDGKKLYELARQGKEIVRPSRNVFFEKIDLLDFDFEYQTAIIDVKCSKGTYIRTLCHDIGNVLGVGGTMKALCRTEACGYILDESQTFEDLENAVNMGEIPKLLTIDSAFRNWEKVELSVELASRFLNGQKLSLDNFSFSNGKPVKPFAIWSKDQFLGVAEIRSNESFLRPIRIF